MREFFEYRDDEDEDSGIIPIFPDEDDDLSDDYSAEERGSSISSLFGGDDDDDDDAPVKLTFGHIERAAKQAVKEAADDDDYDDDDDDDDDDTVTLSFAKAEKKEKDFIFMPFLNIDENEDDDDDEDAVTLSFAKAEKKEKDFVFMPFLNIDENADDDDDDDISYEDDDDDIVLIPLPDSDQTYNNLFQKTEEEDAEGISVVGGDAVPSAPKKPSSGPKKPSGTGGKKKKKPSSGQKRPQSGSNRPPQQRSGSQGQGQGPKKKKKLSHEQQFQRAMRNVNPEVLEAVKRDPVQRAALEQAIRIALVQYAAQEAVAKSNGRIGMDMLAYQKSSGKKPSSQSGQKRPPSGSRPPQKKKKNPNAQRSQSASSRSGFGSIQDFAPVELKSESQTQRTTQLIPPAAQPAQQPIQQQPAAQPPAAPAPAAPQPSAAQQQQRSINPSSPAAIKAAMRAGVDLSAGGAKPAAQSTAPLTPQQRAQAQANAASAANRSGCLIGIIAIFVVFFIAMIAIFVIPVAKERDSYNTAVSMMSEGNYSAALRTLQEIPDYEDSADLINECRYNLGLQYQAKGDYESAIIQFDKILTYEDSATKIVECKYMQGKQKYDTADYREAYDLFCEIASYSDAAELAKLSNYNYITHTFEYAEEKYASGDIEGALKDYINVLGAYDNIDGFLDYEDSYTRWQSMQYKCAQVMLEAGRAGASVQLEQAAELFLELEDYNDSPALFVAAQYELIKLDKADSFTLAQFQYGLEILAQGQVENAAEILAHPAYTGAKLVGEWRSTAYSFTITAENDINSITYNLPGGADSDVIVSFSGSSVEIMRDGETVELMKVTAFTPADSAAPTTAEITVGDTTLTFTKA